MFNIGMDILIDSLYETLALFPYLFLTYLALEFLEHKTSRKTLSYIKKSGSYGPVAGGLLGLIPQCGFSVAAANLYATGIITLGTLMAIFLSTSDEMLPILISGGAGAALIVQILGIKVILRLPAVCCWIFFCRKNLSGTNRNRTLRHFANGKNANATARKTYGIPHTSILKKSAFSSLFSLLSSTPFLHLAAERPCSCC